MVFCLHECLYITCIPFLQQPEGHQIPWNWSFMWLWAAMWFWVLNQGPLEEQPMLLTLSHTSPQLHSLFFISNFSFKLFISFIYLGMGPGGDVHTHATMHVWMSKTTCSFFHVGVITMLGCKQFNPLSRLDGPTMTFFNVCHPAPFVSS